MFCIFFCCLITGASITFSCSLSEVFNASFNVEINSNAVLGISGNTEGILFVTGDTILISGSQIDGSDLMDDVLITVTGISPNPSVYEPYTTEIFERKGGDKRVSYYDENDILNIDWVLNLDSLTSVMLIVVTFISFLVHFYSIEYMGHDPHQPRFMSYFCLLYTSPSPRDRQKSRMPSSA